MDDGGLGPPIDVRPLLDPERAALVDLLASLRPDEWSARAAGPEWSVHEVAVHLVHDDVRRLSAERDGHAQAWIAVPSLDDLAVALDELNQRWVDAVAPSMSPRLTLQTLSWLAVPSSAHLRGLTPGEEAGEVAWAGPGPHPNWFDVAREFTERWVHQQQIRLAVGRPGLMQREYLEPVVDTFARALPVVLPGRPEGTVVHLETTAPFLRRWAVVSTASGWRFTGPSDHPAAVVSLPADILWRRAVRMLTMDEAHTHARTTGDRDLVAAVLTLRGAIVRDRG